ncbi:MAG: biopolymer transporter ExbD [Parvibaculum sp.]
MNARRVKRSGYKPDGTLPLINIVLLLVLAFMMAGTFVEPMPTNFSPLRSEGAEPLRETVEPVVLTMNAQGIVSLDGRNQSVGELDSLLSGLGRSEHGVEVRADARAPAVHVITLLGSAESAGIKDVQIVTLGRK